MGKRIYRTAGRSLLHGTSIPIGEMRRSPFGTDCLVEDGAKQRTTPHIDRCYDRVFGDNQRWHLRAPSDILPPRNILGLAAQKAIYHIHLICVACGPAMLIARGTSLPDGHMLLTVMSRAAAIESDRRAQ